MKKGTIFFDYDGTLHDSMRVYGPAFRKGVAWLEKEGYLAHQEYDDEWISHWLGWTTSDMWQTFTPQLPEEVWRNAAHIVGAEMDRLSSSGQGRLFEGIPEALTQLKQAGYTLAFLSNCRHAYRDAHRQFYNLDEWFDVYHCAQDFPGLAKWEIYQRVITEETHPGPHVMVGDRFHDIEVASKAHIASIGCAYGFGEADELNAASIIIEAPSELPGAVEEVLA